MKPVITALWFEVEVSFQR